MTTSLRTFGFMGTPSRRTDRKARLARRHGRRGPWEDPEPALGGGRESGRVSRSVRARRGSVRGARERTGPRRPPPSGRRDDSGISQAAPSVLSERAPTVLSMSEPPPSERPRADRSSSEPTLSPKELAQAKLRARAARIGRLRKRVIAASLATFVLAFGVIAVDGPMGATTAATSQTSASVTSSSGTSGTSTDSTGSDQSSILGDDSSSSDGTTSSSGNSTGSSENQTSSSDDQTTSSDDDSSSSGSSSSGSSGSTSSSNSGSSSSSSSPSTVTTSQS